MGDQEAPIDFAVEDVEQGITNGCVFKTFWVSVFNTDDSRGMNLFVPRSREPESSSSGPSSIFRICFANDSTKWACVRGSSLTYVRIMYALFFIYSYRRRPLFVFVRVAETL